MIQCKDCELCETAADGQVQLRCNPFTNVKEPECLTKWQLLRLDMMTRAYMLTVAEYRKLAPLQERLYRRMSREMDDMDESDSWKAEEEDGPDDKGGPEIPPLDDRL
jgi:hypothetical protein